MQPFSDKAGKKLLAEVRRVFVDKKIYFSLNPQIVFVCGGTKRTTFRSKFLTYIKKSKIDLNTFAAEDAVRNLLAHNTPEFINLAQFEDLIGSIFDCILIFPESPGSYAELGFFAKNETLRKKTLIANDIERQADSFINLGPVALVEESSVYRPTIYLDKKAPDFDKVVQRLLRFQKTRIYREGFEFKNYTKLSTKAKFAVVLQLIQIFRGIKLAGLVRCFRYIFRSADELEIRRFISILHTAGFIQRLGSNNDHFAISDDGTSLLDIEHTDLDTLAARVLHYYQEHDKAIFDLATGSAK